MSIKASNRSSIVIDTNRLYGEGHMDLLMKASQYRLYSLFYLFAAQGAKTFSRAIHYAVSCSLITIRIHPHTLYYR